MNNTSDLGQRSSVLIYEPRVEGHHLSYLKFLVEDLCSADFPLALAVDTRPKQFALIENQLGGLLKNVRVFSVCDANGRRAGDGYAGSVATCLEKSGADTAFLNSFDEIASVMLRQVALGRRPPDILRGRCGGIYLRPRFMGGGTFSLNLWLKSIGFKRLLRQNWFRQLLFLDPFLQAQLKAMQPDAPMYFLPDPFPDDFAADPAIARRQLNIPPNKCVLLFYGGAYRRKGLRVAIAAMRKLPQSLPAFLLFAGHQPEDATLSHELKLLESEGRARLLNHYVSDAEEKFLFAVCDFVLLPYLKHFGSSGVLSRAAGAGKPVIASDEQLIGRLVRKRRLGLLFPSGNAPALGRAIIQALKASPEEKMAWQKSAATFAGQYSRAAFRSALLASFAER